MNKVGDCYFKVRFSYDSSLSIKFQMKIEHFKEYYNNNDIIFHPLNICRVSHESFCIELLPQPLHIFYKTFLYRMLFYIRPDLKDNHDIVMIKNLEGKMEECLRMRDNEMMWHKIDIIETAGRFGDLYDELKKNWDNIIQEKLIIKNDMIVGLQC